MNSKTDLVAYLDHLRDARLALGSALDMLDPDSSQSMTDWQSDHARELKRLMIYVNQMGLMATVSQMRQGTRHE